MSPGSSEITPTPIVIPGVASSPLVIAILAVIGSIVTEFVNFQWITGTLANQIVGIAGIAIPLGVWAYDAFLRNSAAKVAASYVGLLTDEKGTTTTQRYEVFFG